MNHDQFRGLRAVVRHVLENAEKFTWSLQGFGMLRLHLSDDVRIHVWDPEFAVPGVSMIHDHAQWGLSSTVICGVIRNVMYMEEKEGPHPFYCAAMIRAGQGGGMLSPLPVVRLNNWGRVTYRAGHTYSQKPHEIHESIPQSGTVTVMTKTPTDTDDARVFWPIGKEWVSAEPREAKSAEVQSIVRRALIRMRSELEMHR